MTKRKQPEADVGDLYLGADESRKVAQEGENFAAKVGVTEGGPVAGRRTEETTPDVEASGSVPVKETGQVAKS